MADSLLTITHVFHSSFKSIIYIRILLIIMSALQAMLDKQGGSSEGPPRRRQRGGGGGGGYGQNQNQRQSERRNTTQRSNGRDNDRNNGRNNGTHGNRRNNNNNSSSNADQIYANIYKEINTRARQKQASFLTTSTNTATNPKEASERAIAAEQALLRSWVGELRPDTTTPTTTTSTTSTTAPTTTEICEYYQDRTKQYPFFTSKDGYTLLQRLLDNNVILLAANMALILAKGDPQFVAAQGELIYEMKPSLKAYNKTWSQEEYGHPGLQRTYIKLKSFQRFTETWATLERTAAEGLFDIHKETSKPLRVASIGGGPGYELLAMKMFFERFAPNVSLELISLDLCPSWCGYVEALGFKFIHWDIHSGNLLDTLNMSPGDLDYVIISYVLIYCSDDPTMDMLASLLTEGQVRAIIVSERSERTAGVGMMEKRGMTVCKLMDQSMGQDERQCIYVSDSNLLLSTSIGNNGSENAATTTAERKQFVPVFPNVPFSEHKKARQEGGHRLGWRPFHGR